MANKKSPWCSTEFGWIFHHLAPFFNGKSVLTLRKQETRGLGWWGIKMKIGDRGRWWWIFRGKTCHEFFIILSLSVSIIAMNYCLIPSLHITDIFRLGWWGLSHPNHSRLVVSKRSPWSVGKRCNLTSKKYLSNGLKPPGRRMNMMLRTPTSMQLSRESIQFQSTYQHQEEIIMILERVERLWNWSKKGIWTNKLKLHGEHSRLRLACPFATQSLPHTPGSMEVPTEKKLKQSVTDDVREFSTIPCKYHYIIYTWSPKDLYFWRSTPLKQGLFR